MMPSLRRALAGLSALLRKRQVEQELDAELREYFDAAVDAKCRTGLDRPAAVRAIRLEMGSVDTVKERVRDVSWESSLDVLFQDVRYAARTMRRAPGFAAIAVGSAALGIGACSLIFALLNAAILKTPPVDDPARLMNLSESDPRSGEVGNELSFPDLLDLRQARSFEGVAACDPLVPASFGASGDPQRLWGALVTANYFAVVRPGFALGRGFDPGREDAPGGPRVVVLSHDLWRVRFHADPAIIGRSVSINARAATVVGVTAAGFRGTDVGIAPEFWMPFSMLDEIESRQGPVSRNRERHWLRGVGRLRAGVDAQAARAELEVIARGLNASFRRGDQSRGFHLEPAGRIDPRLRGMTVTLFLVVLAAAVLVLLTACANVASLLLGRAAARRGEIAVRLALGASRRRLLRQLLTESLTLALLGGVGGWAIAVYGASLMGLVRTPFGWPLDLSVSLDYRVLIFCLGLSLATGLVFGLVPALRSTRPDLVSDLKADGRGPLAFSRPGVHYALVVAQVAICTLLLLCSGLFVRSLQAARSIDLGLTGGNLLLLGFDPALDHRADADARRLLRDVLARVQMVSGVESVTLTTAVPLTFIIDNSSFVSAAHAGDASAPRIGADIYGVAPRFFETMGIAFRAGHELDAENAGNPLASVGSGRAVVNEAFARAVFPEGSPLGRRFVGDGKNLEIVGVVATAKSRTIGESPRPSIYLPLLSEYTGASARGVTLIVKTGGAPATFAGLVRDAIRQADPSLAVFDVRTLESHLRDAQVVPRLVGAISVLAGGSGLAIATIGVYGVINFAVVRRRREIGIRLAVGAKPREVLVMVLRQGLTLASVGTAIGLLLGFGVTRFAASLLYGVSAGDVLTFVATPLLITLVALVACLLPARAAARVDPVDVLRAD
jgi:macrolide transport system ATP-binding/permease protein